MQETLISKRLRNEMVRQGLNSAELAKRAQLKASFIYDVLSGKSANPSTIKLAKVAETLGVNLAYLVGSMAEHQADAVISGAAESHYIDIPPLTRRPESSPHLAAAQAQRFQREWIRQTLNANPGSLRVFSVQDDSMAPTLCQNDTVLLDISMTQPNPPGIFALNDGIGIILKRVERIKKPAHAALRILSDNPHYAPDERAPEEIQIVGRVVWFSRKL